MALCFTVGGTHCYQPTGSVSNSQHTAFRLQSRVDYQVRSILCMPLVWINSVLYPNSGENACVFNVRNKIQPITPRKTQTSTNTSNKSVQRQRTQACTNKTFRTLPRFRRGSSEIHHRIARTRRTDRNGVTDSHACGGVLDIVVGSSLISKHDVGVWSLRTERGRVR